jgi:hypothetical protein
MNQTERLARAEKKRLADHERRCKKANMVKCPRCNRLHARYNPDNYCSTSCREAPR